MEHLLPKKLESIRELKAEASTYFEANHCFIKGFGWLLPQELGQESVGVIVLGRDKAQVVDSHLRVGSSPLTSKGRKWVSVPDTRTSLLDPPGSRVFYHYSRLAKWFVDLSLVRKVFGKRWKYPRWLQEYERRCLEWYVDETRAKAAAFKEKYPKIRYYDVRIEELNEIAAVHRMLTHFGCNALDSLAATVGKPANLKPDGSEWRDQTLANRLRVELGALRRRVTAKVFGTNGVDICKQ